MDLVQTDSSITPVSMLPFNADSSVVQATTPGDLRVIERDYVDSVFTLTGEPSVAFQSPDVDQGVK